MANISYMQHFTFAQSTDDRHDFTLVCFEASLQHIRDGSITVPIPKGGEPISLHDSTYTPHEIYRNCVLLNRCDEIAVILGKGCVVYTAFEPTVRIQ